MPDSNRPTNIQFRNSWILERLQERDRNASPSATAQRELVRYYCLLDVALSTTKLLQQEFDFLCDVTLCDIIHDFAQYIEEEDEATGAIRSLHADLVGNILYQLHVKENPENYETFEVQRCIANWKKYESLDLQAFLEKASRWTLLQAFAVAELVDRRPYLSDLQLGEIFQKIHDQHDQYIGAVLLATTQADGTVMGVKISSECSGNS